MIPMLQRWNLILRAEVDIASKKQNRGNIPCVLLLTYQTGLNVIDIATQYLTSGQRKSLTAFKMKINSSSHQVKFGEKKHLQNRLDKAKNGNQKWMQSWIYHQPRPNITGSFTGPPAPSPSNPFWVMISRLTILISNFTRYSILTSLSLNWNFVKKNAVVDSSLHLLSAFIILSHFYLNYLILFSW